MRQAVRAIIIRDNKLLVMHRNKFGREYDTLPGGRVDKGESLNEALHRELSEETGIEISDQRLVYIEHAGDPYGDQYIFLCEYAGGEPKLRSDSDEEAINRLGDNLYQPGWSEVSRLAEQPFVSPRLKQRILQDLKNGWPAVPAEI